MKYKHYAPKAELCIYEGEMSKVINENNNISAKMIKNNEKIGILCTDESFSLYKCGIIKLKFNNIKTCSEVRYGTSARS